MTITIDKHWRVEEDASSWNLVYEKKGKVNPKTGKPSISSDVSYHANMKQALVTYLQKSTKGAGTIQDAVTAMNSAEARVMQAVDKIKGKK